MDQHIIAENCWKHTTEKKQTGYYCLVTFCTTGPRNDLPKEYNPKEVIALLNQRKQDILCVRGNCDTEVDQMVLEFPVLADYCVIADEKNVIYATHGHHFNDARSAAVSERRHFAEWAYPCTKMCGTSGLYLHESRICFYSKRGKLAWIYDI